MFATTRDTTIAGAGDTCYAWLLDEFLRCDSLESACIPNHEHANRNAVMANCCAAVVAAFEISRRHQDCI